jgi:hypothetical protein
MHKLVGQYIEVIDESGNIGTIQYYYDDDTKNDIILSNLYVNETYRRTGYGSFLMFVFFHYLNFTKQPIKSITLEDASDKAKTRASIYYKFGFRITDSTATSDMNLYFTQDKTTQEQIIDAYNKNGYQYDSSSSKDSITIYNSIQDYLDKQNMHFNSSDTVTIKIYNNFQHGPKQYLDLVMSVDINAKEEINNNVMKLKFNEKSSSKRKSKQKSSTKSKGGTTSESNKNKRYFSVIMINGGANKDTGRYTAERPIDVAKKLAQKQTKHHYSYIISFCIHETTKNSKKKTYGYVATISKDKIKVKANKKTLR